MRIHVITLFPEMFESVLGTGLLGRAIRGGIVSVRLHALRRFGLGRYGQVDDEPYGGGNGMVMRPEPIVAAIEAVEQEEPGVHRILLTPAGELLTQRKVQELARFSSMVLICGRYEGVDERVRSFVHEELSVGDYILNGGELAALIVIEATTRLLPGVLGNPESLKEESFSQGLLEYPHYTRPREFRGLTVPEVLLSGNHERIRQWRLQQARKRTAERRSDLFWQSKD